LAEPFSVRQTLNISEEQDCQLRIGIDTTYPYQLSPRLGQRLIFCQRDVGQKRSVADNRGVRVSLDICPPLPAGGVGVASSDVFGLEAFELLLVAKLVGLELKRVELARVTHAIEGLMIMAANLASYHCKG
jgi:hypothetical protein